MVAGLSDVVDVDVADVIGVPDVFDVAEVANVVDAPGVADVADVACASHSSLGFSFLPLCGLAMHATQFVATPDHHCGLCARQCNTTR